jgi:CBS domain-containing protein
MKQIAEIIKGRPLFHVQSSANVRDVARQMTEKNIGAIAVLDAGKLVGVFSERDLMSRVVARGLDPDKTAVRDVMTHSLVVAEPVDNIDSALKKMNSLGCRHLPVVERGNLVGMISLRDLLLIDDQANREKASFLSELVTYSPDYDS